MVPADLRTLFPDASQLLDRCDPLDSFIERRLCEARAWRDGQSSDGIELVRVLEREPTRLRLCGRIYEISDQLAHAFWLELELDGTDGVSWTLRFDVMGTDRQKRHALDLYDDPDHIEWRVALAGEGILRDGKLVESSGVALERLADSP